MPKKSTKKAVESKEKPTEQSADATPTKKTVPPLSFDGHEKTNIPETAFGRKI